MVWLWVWLCKKGGNSREHRHAKSEDLSITHEPSKARLQSRFRAAKALSVIHAPYVPWCSVDRLDNGWPKGLGNKPGSG